MLLILGGCPESKHSVKAKSNPGLGWPSWLLAYHGIDHLAHHRPLKRLIRDS